MVIAVALALQDEGVRAPGQELDGVEGLHVFVAGLSAQLVLALACLSIVADEAAVVLVAVQLLYKDVLRVGAPGQVGEIAEGLQRCCSIGDRWGLEVEGFPGGDVEDADGDHVGVSARHGVFVGLHLSNGGADALGLRPSLAWERRYAHLRIVGDHALVHAVESKMLAVGAPESALRDAKLVAMDALSVDYFAAAVGGELMLLALGVDHEQLAVLHVCGGFRLGAPVVGLLAREAVLPNNLLLFEVDEQEGVAVSHGHDGLVGVGERGRHEVAHLSQVAVALSPLVNLVEGEQLGLLSRLRVDEATFLHVGLHQLVAPPGEEHVLRAQVVIVASAEVQVFQCEKLLLGIHGHGKQQCKEAVEKRLSLHRG